MLSRGQCGPHTRFSRNRSCTQLRTSRGYEALDATAPQQRQRQPWLWQGLPTPGLPGVGTQQHTHTHTQAQPAARAGLSWHLRLPGLLVCVPFLPLTRALACPPPSHFLLLLLSLHLDGGAGLQVLLPSHTPLACCLDLPGTETQAILITAEGSLGQADSLQCLTSASEKGQARTGS